MGSIIKGSVDPEVGIEVTHVVTNHIYHHQDVPFVASVDEILEILLRPEIIIEFVEISTPVSVVSSISIVDNGGDPDGIESHALYIV